MGGPPDRTRSAPLPRNPIRRLGKELKSAFRIANLIAEEWYRQFVAWSYQLRGYVVIFDRHFFLDYYAHHIESRGERTLPVRFHGFMLAHLFPKPRTVIHLDAPAEVLYARKREGTLEAVRQRREEYLQMQNLVENFIIIDVSQPVDQVADQVTRLILDLQNRDAR